MSNRVVPVGLLTSYIRELLDGDELLSDVWVEGEISSQFLARSGHCYFTVKDEQSQLKCVLFRHLALRQHYQPQTGDQVAAHGHISVYEREGSYQLYVDVVQPAGMGVLALQLEQLRQKLEAEGLFDEARKRPLPTAPRRIGVVTSPDGAVWHDIQHVIRRRYPLVELILSPASVQGERAPGSLVAALEALQRDTEVDVIIVARGGGSPEDLWAFNDEALARAVFACRKPVISGVGHETDWTIIDYVADLRAPTPSAAAEVVVPNLSEIRAHLGEQCRRLDDAIDHGLSGHAYNLRATAGRLRQHDPRLQTARWRSRTREFISRAQRAQHELLVRDRLHLARSVSTLDALSPRAVLERGYAVLTDAATARPISRAASAHAGQTVRASLADGDLDLTIEQSRVSSSAHEQRPRQIVSQR